MASSSVGKPIDLGAGRVCASFDPATAAWLSIGTPHSRHGFVELSAMPPFDEATRGDPAATRAHRRAMAIGAPALFTVEVHGATPALVADVRDPALPRWRSGRLRASAWASPDAALIVQRWSFGERRDVVLRLRGRLDRPALAEITELDPPVPTGAITAAEPIDGGIRLRAAALPAEAVVSVAPAARWDAAEGGYVGRLKTSELTVVIRIGERPGAAGPADLAPPVSSGLDADALTRAALAYVRGCTALRVAPGQRAILTDHRLLPLSWTRDAYWQALALLVADGPGDRERVADHLRWLWAACERPDGRWARSHHANGRRKDLAFQADQQLYPLIELADHWRAYGELPEGIDWPSAIEPAWRAARSAVDPRLGLMASTENAADDPATAPFIGASQILAWYAAERLAEIGEAERIGLEPASLRADADAARAAFTAHHAAIDGPWAYAVDRDDVRVDYHDANDLPVAIAPLLGFCLPDDPGWLATMAFAFGPSNTAWVAGPFGGLGSIHTPGAWTLGDVQAWTRARITGDRPAAAAALDRLRAVAFGDGMLPEAYGADRDARIRHWFAWPGAALAALRLLDDAGRLETTLGVRRR
jgi:hypothetical protein